jgi:hypothetical protein
LKEEKQVLFAADVEVLVLLLAALFTRPWISWLRQ